MNSVANAGSLEIGANDYSAELEFGQILSDDSKGASEFNVKGMYNSSEETWIFATGLDVYGELIEGLKLGVGAKVFVVNAEEEDEEVAALSFGGFARYAPSFLGGFGFYGGAYYAPNIFTWIDGDHMLDIDVGVDFQFIPRARIFVGYNRTKVDFEDHGSSTEDEGVRGGLVLNF